MSDLRTAFQEAAKTLSIESSKEAEVDSVDNSEVAETLETNIAPQEEADKEVATEKVNGYQKRINNITAQKKAIEEKYSAELQKRDAEIAELREQFKSFSKDKDEEELPEFEDVKQLLDYNKKYVNETLAGTIERLVQEQLAKVSNTYLEKDATEKAQSKQQKLATEIQKEYGKLFNDGIFDGENFNGTDAEEQLLNDIAVEFQKSPDFWLDKINKFGMKTVASMIGGNFEPPNKVKQLADIVESAGKAKTLQTSTKAIDNELLTAKSMLERFKIAAKKINK